MTLNLFTCQMIIATPVVGVRPQLNEEPRIALIENLIWFSTASPSCDGRHHVFLRTFIESALLERK
jgi:hypothetical protein